MADNGKSTLLVSLDYSAAFDTIDHSIFSLTDMNTVLDSLVRLSLGFSPISLVAVSLLS